MTSISDPRNPFSVVPQVNYDEPAIKPPPLLQVGPLAWARNNLFRSTFDTLMTMAFGLIAISVVIGALGWAIGSANWFVINVNLRAFMVGRFPVEELWRVSVMALYLLFVAGFSVGTWGRFTRGFAALVLVMIAVMFIVPPIVDATTEKPVAYLAAGNSEIKAGTVTEVPLPDVGFIGRQGDVVSVTIPTISGDDDVARIAGFSDRATEAVINAAANRQSIFDQRAVLEGQLESDLLTAEQRADLTADLDKLKVPNAVTSTVGLNTEPVQVQILDGASGDVLAEQTLSSNADVLKVTLPTSGWYLLHKTVEAKSGVTLLETTGISPHIASLQPSGGDLYTRAVDGFETTAERPQVEKKDAPMLVLLDNQFIGIRSFATYMSLLVAPFFRQANVTLLALTMACAAGYVVARAAKRIGVQGRSNLARRVTPVLWLAAPIIIYALIATVNPDRWGGLLLTFLLTAVGLVASFPIGVLLALGRRSHLPIVKVASVLYIELVRGVPLISVLFMAQMMLPLLDPNLQNVPGVLRAMAGITLFSAAYLAENVRGGLQAIPPGQEEAAHALGLSTFQVIMRITLPQALRLVIPALVGQAISLFKDTTLVAIVGLFDLLRIADTSVSQAEFVGLRAETYFFIAIIYFIFSFLMTYVSRRIEASGSGVLRRIG